MSEEKTTTIISTTLRKMEGRWRLDLSQSDSYDPVLKYMGMSWMKRTIACRTVSVHQIEFDAQLNAMKMKRDVLVIGYNVGSSNQIFYLDGEERELSNDDQSFAVKSFATASTNGSEVVVETTFITKDGKKAIEHATRKLEGDQMVLLIRFTGPPDVDVSMKRVFKKEK